MCTYGFFFVPANLLFLSLGVLLIMLTQQEGLEIPANTDDLLPMFAATGKLGTTVTVLFTIGIVAACFSSADSALTALTTSFCVDIKERPQDESLRRKAHIAICVVFTIFILVFRMVNSTNVIDAIYTLCSYTYGPLLGLFAFGLLTHRQPRDSYVPYIAVASPIICYLIDALTTQFTGYTFGYELLMLNGLLTYLGLWVVSKKSQSIEK
jgi:Na+/proline symporter